ncbi:fructose-bisphosphate aldolase, class II/tagatose 1,6-diphosphate aldolase GatY/KbaY [Halolactibacillus halophilus]|uniref:Fructose-bisphosphate aldolase n=1 Tax=Halolactibacillus halophilus TaxID=306540 RepID=A0A1I5R4A3_9BACI|nr:class II fructose-bisphosphate aldolase [Halolactibacillus halophilus]GEM02718.1 fructose-bisphosphate aldolase [Halolactibacillus halophilus]SFP53131.1 fructose-bisphosphate aldolase, class II/tagatose 1,6-diphosphate aldolase GatY/KbaY [Halolactibacillus halophilus]
MLVNSKELLLKAKNEKFAIPATNFIDLDTARVFVNVAEQRGLPLILPFAQSHSHLISLEEAAMIGKFFAEKATVPIVLHLDHGEDVDFIFKAIDLGFKSVMIDASREPFKDNIEITKKVVEYAHKHDVTVEAELGHVGANDTSESSEITDSIYTEVNDVIEFLESTHVDSLAISIGTAHGIYKGSPKLNFERLSEINSMVDIPLVLHGGSSTGDANLNKCAIGGMAKINIYTDFLTAAVKSIKSDELKDYVEIKQNVAMAMAEVLNHYYDVFETNRYKGGEY